MATKCKVCGKDIVIGIAVEGDPTWTSRLLPMATCPTCFAAVNKYRTAENKLATLCGRFANRKLSLQSTGARMEDKESSAFHVSIVKHVTAYGTALMMFHNSREIVDAQDAAQTVFDMPDKLWEILRRYRTGVALYYKTPSLNPWPRKKAA